MPSKTEEYLALAQRTANGLTRYWENWTDYLTTASRLYKYPFADQLMIYVQRPSAVLRPVTLGYIRLLQEHHSRPVSSASLPRDAW